MPSLSAAKNWNPFTPSAPVQPLETPPDPATLGEVQQFIQESTVALLTTTDPQGNLHSRPVEAPSLDGDGMLWFFSSAADPLLREVMQRPEVQLTCVNGASGRCMVVSGIARLRRDAARSLSLWKPALASGFPGGPHDPSLALVNVRVIAADLWD